MHLMGGAYQLVRRRHHRLLICWPVNFNNCHTTRTIK
jgi:hypothetical protein